MTYWEIALAMAQNHVPSQYSKLTVGKTEAGKKLIICRLNCIICRYKSYLQIQCRLADMQIWGNCSRSDKIWLSAWISANLICRFLYLSLTSLRLIPRWMCFEHSRLNLKPSLFGQHVKIKWIVFYLTLLISVNIDPVQVILSHSIFFTQIWWSEI